jgi:UDP-N-acetylmuramoylalanine--D-glutamate ligase
MAAYKGAKAHILAYQQSNDIAVLNRDAPAIRDMGKGCAATPFFYSIQESLAEGTYVDNQAVYLCRSGQQQRLFKATDLKLPGSHNLSNAVAAATLAALFGVPAEIIAQGIRQFDGLPHRMEYVATRHGIAFYNDSKATTPVSTIRALQAFNQPVVLLAGGYDKGTPFDELGEVIAKSTKAAMIYGKTAPKLTRAIAKACRACNRSLAGSVQRLDNLDSAFQQALAVAKPGDAVLLSPACASYDQFPHFEARGEHFRQLVMALPPG